MYNHQVCAALRARTQAFMMTDETRAQWELLFTDFTKFNDFRHFKTEMGGNGPDFKNKQTGESLW